MRKRFSIGMAAIGLSAWASFAVAQEDGKAEPSAQPEPQNTIATGMGLICWAAIVEAVSHIGNRCVENEDPELRKELERSTEAMGRYLIEEGDWTEEELARFHAEQGNLDVPDGFLCAGDGPNDIYEAFASNGVGALAAQTDQMLALDGPPVWGTCL
ncbi:MAG: hypothetical protein AAGK02_11570 [Pseudomonadota bacterium]